MNNDTTQSNAKPRLDPATIEACAKVAWQKLSRIMISDDGNTFVADEVASAIRSLDSKGE